MVRRARQGRAWRVTRLGWGAFAAVAMVAGMGVVHGVTGRHMTEAAARSLAPPAAVTWSQPTAGAIAVGAIPGLGPDFLARVPAGSSQVVLASGAGINASDTTVTLYTRGADGRWTAGASWPAHNALRGWTSDHHLDDLRSPIGVYTLTDAGGLNDNPGTRLPYTRSADFTAVGTGFEGESLAGVFDYVVAINYNHVAGSSPLDPRRPMGEQRGGGIWLHVDHGGPTHGCVSLSKQDMIALLQWLDPTRHPVIVMGDAHSLSA